MGLRKKHLVGFAVVALAGGEISAASADVLILRSLGPSAGNYPAGRRVADNASFNLRPGDSVVVLAGTGTRTFRGPGVFAANGAVRTAGNTNGQVRRQTGAVRGPGESEVRRPNDIWQFDVTRTGRVCLLPGARPVLWRPSSERTVQLTITPQMGQPQVVTWAAGRNTLDWPAGVPLANGNSYQLNWTGAMRPTRLTAYTLSGVAPANAEAVATALLANQCRSQLEVFIATRDVDSLPAGGGMSGGEGAPR